jgi:DNA-binding NarL/FixJ family response regulator
VAAAAVGADAVVSKSDTPRALLEAVRDAAHGRAGLPEIPLPVRARFAAKLEPTDRAILAMRLAGTTPAEIAETIGLTAARVRARIARIVARLTPASPFELATAGPAPDFGPPRR